MDMGISLWHALLFGGMAGLFGTGLGGLFGYLLKKPKPSTISGLLNLSGGLMVAIVCFNLLPQAYKLSGITPALSGVFVGIAFMAFVQLFMEKKGQAGNHGNNLRQTGILVSIGIALHNFPEGLAIGAGFAQTPTLGISLCIAIALHDVLEGISMAVPLKAVQVPSSRVFAYTLLAGAPTAVGVLLGYATIWLGSAKDISAPLISVCMGLAAGAMLYVVADELLPNAYDLHKGHVPAFLWIIGLLIGSIAALVL